jgi:hypothetical protein
VTTPTPTPTVRKLGPGTLSVGEAGSTVDLAVRCRSARVVPSVDQEDDVPLLSGDTSAGDRTYTYALEATLEQDDLVDGSVTRFTWDNAGAQLPFSFTPYTFDGALTITGDVIVDPMEIGGDVGKKNTADIAWGIIGAPELAEDL